MDIRAGWFVQFVDNVANRITFASFYDESGMWCEEVAIPAYPTEAWQDVVYLNDILRPHGFVVALNYPAGTNKFLLERLH